MKKLLLVGLLIGVGYASWLRAEGTEVMNTYGEHMELGFNLYDPGTETIVDYARYGEFENIGTNQYSYKITDRKGLSAALGEGISPNNSVYKDPTYRLLSTKGRLTGSQWDYVNTDDQLVAFYKWATSHDTPAVQQFYTALALEKLGEYKQAVKCYYNIVVQFPKQAGWTVFHTPIYMSRLAIDHIEFILKKHPELGLKLIDASIKVKNGYNMILTDDQFVVNPGRLVSMDQKSLSESASDVVDVSKLKVVQTLGGPSIQLRQFENHHWQMWVDGKPFIIKAVAYSPTPIGQSPHEGYDLQAWMVSDLNQNGQIDGPFDAWLDKNKNNIQDADEPSVGDFALMKEMGVNTIRLYHHAMNKELLRRLYNEYGIRVIMGDLLGMYATGSGAEWFQGTDYTNLEQREKMKESVRSMVMEHKDEPYILMWMLGNESNYGMPGDPSHDKVGLGSQARNQPEAHYGFVNEVAGMIKSIDTNHPVGFSNGEVMTIDVLAQNSSHLDVVGINAYRGADGFGPSFWGDAREYMDKPVLLTEYGCPAYYSGKNSDFAEDKQRGYHKGNWEDIMANTAGFGFGNAIGGVAFEFVDEWWKAGPPPKFDSKAQETIGDFQANFPDGWMYEEWLGIMSQGDGNQSPYMRQARKVYDYYKEAWKQ